MSWTKLTFTGQLLVQRAREGHLSRSRQLAEIAWLGLRNGIGPGTYYASGLYRADIPWRVKQEYVGYARYRRALARLNPEQFRCMARNKLVTAGLLQLFDIPAPRCYGHLSLDAGQTFDARPLRSAGDLKDLIERVGIDRMCFKPLTGYGGKGFVRIAIRVRAGKRVGVVLEPEDRELGLDTFWGDILVERRGRGYLCQEVVAQHPTIADLNPSSVNTARVWMRKGADRRWSIFGAFLRIGVGLVAVDNTSAGGLAARIDLATGRLDAAIDKRPERGTYPRHPCTDQPIAGRVVPDWGEARQICIRTGHAFGYLSLLGVDVAFGVAGPLVLEVNEEPDASGQISMGRGIATLLEPGYQGEDDSELVPGPQSRVEGVYASKCW